MGKKILTEPELEHVLYSINKHAEKFQEKSYEMMDAQYLELQRVRNYANGTADKYRYKCRQHRDRFLPSKCMHCYREYEDIEMSIDLPEGLMGGIDSKLEDIAEEGMAYDEMKDTLYDLEDDLIDRFLTPLCAHMGDNSWNSYSSEPDYLYYKTATRCFHQPTDGCPVGVQEMPFLGGLFVPSDADCELMSVENIMEFCATIDQYDYAGGKYDDYPGDHVVVPEFLRILSEQLTQVVLENIKESYENYDEFIDWWTGFTNDYLADVDVDAILDTMENFAPWREWRLSGFDANLFKNMAFGLGGPEFDDVPFAEVMPSIREQVEKHIVLINDDRW